MERSSRDAWLNGAGDLREAEVQDVPVKGQSVRVRGLPAAYSNEAASKAVEVVEGRRGEKTSRINTKTLQVLQFAYGVIEPTFTPEEAELIATKYGPAFDRVVAKIDELTGIDEEAVEHVNDTFPVGGRDAPREDMGDGTPPLGGGPDLHVRAGVGAEDAA